MLFLHRVTANLTMPVPGCCRRARDEEHFRIRLFKKRIMIERLIQ